jgi:hypothetical protein
VDDTTTKADTAVSFEQAKTAVQDFQVRRLKRDFHDLRKSQEYGPFSEFFASEIYSARDFTERNESFRRVTNQFRHVIGEEIYVGLVRLLDLHSLTDRLDGEVAAALIGMGQPLDFNEAEYEEAYRLLDNYDERLLQIELILESLEFTHHVSQMTLIGVVLKSAKLATGLFTKDRIVDLLERAYSMLRHIRDITYLNDEVRKREVARLDRIYGK